MANKRETSLTIIRKLVNTTITSIEGSRDLLSQNLKTKMSKNDDKGSIDIIEKFIRIYVSLSGYERILFAIDNISMNLDNVKTKNVMDSIDFLTSMSKLDGSEVIKKQLKEFPAAKHPNVNITHDVLVLYGKEKINIDDIQKYFEKVNEFTGVSMTSLYTLILLKYPSFEVSVPGTSSGFCSILPPAGYAQSGAQVLLPMPENIPEVEPSPYFTQIQQPPLYSLQPPSYTIMQQNSPSNGAPTNGVSPY